MVRRLIDDHFAGRNRFSKRGECLYVVRNRGAVIAVGGLNIDPYYNSPSLGRIRHLYVHPSFRRTGVGRRLMERIESDGEQYFQSFQLFTTSKAAGRFYEALSYAPVTDRWKVSHAKPVGA
jgi:GNAT superfamily N-acetyltransferase